MKIVNLTLNDVRVRLEDGSILECPTELSTKHYGDPASTHLNDCGTRIDGLLKVVETHPSRELPEWDEDVFYIVSKELCLSTRYRDDLFYVPDDPTLCDKDGVYSCLAV